MRACAVRSKTEPLLHSNTGRPALSAMTGTAPWHAPPTFFHRHTQILYVPCLWMCFHPSGVPLIVLFFFEYLLSWACPTGKPRPHVRSEASISFALIKRSRSGAPTQIFKPSSSFQEACLLSKNQFALPTMRGPASMQLSSGLRSCIPIPSILPLFLKKRTPQ